METWMDVTGRICHPRYPRHWAWLMFYDVFGCTEIVSPQPWLSSHRSTFISSLTCTTAEDYWRWLFAFVVISTSTAGSHQKSQHLRHWNNLDLRQNNKIYCCSSMEGQPASNRSNFSHGSHVCYLHVHSCVYLRQLPRSCQSFWPCLPGEVVTIWWPRDPQRWNPSFDVLCRKPKSLNRSGRVHGAEFPGLINPWFIQRRVPF